MSIFLGVARLSENLSKHSGAYPCLNQETRRIDEANSLIKELTDRNVLEALARTAPDLAAGLEYVATTVGLLGRASDHLGLGTDLHVVFGFKEKRVMQELDELSKNISRLDQEIAKPSLPTSLSGRWAIYDKVLSAVLHFEQSIVHDHHPLPGSDRDRETYCKRLGHMVREYSPTQVIIDLRRMHCLIMGEAGFVKPLFMQLAEENKAYTLETEKLDKFLGFFFFSFLSVIALQVRALRMLLSFIMYKQEDAIYERDLVDIAKNVVLQLGEKSNPVSQFSWYVKFKAYGHENAMIASLKWPGWFAYMTGVIGNLEGCKGHPGDEGRFKIEPHHGGTYKISTRRWRDYYVYMSIIFRNVRGCKGDPGNQGYWKYNNKDIRTRTFTLTPVQYPNCHMHMASTRSGNLSGKRGNLDDSCYFKLVVEPVGHDDEEFEFAVQS